MMSEYGSIFSAIAPLWLIAVITPGPNFLMTTQTSLECDRKHGFVVVLGLVCGTFIWSLAAFFGVHYLFQLAPWIYKSLKIVGAAYLVYLGVTVLIATRKHEGSSDAFEAQASVGRSFAKGLLTNLSNPKTAIFISSLYATTIPEQTPIFIGFVCSGQIVLISLIWYGLVAMVFSTEAFSIRYLRHQRPLKAVSGILYIILGVRIGLRRQ